ncbi:hypothetical protein [Marinobacter sp. SS21]|uniref:hypothetical protein n=1 Tax=Marinobacter sp. SS21 TaxID=2979460 RepID=UPI00232DFA1A|nr:hypothetical protein [Marinobacter sp. SS21]MDC0661913.1 hypothetical protein [Marinobacter sp. SS21]
MMTPKGWLIALWLVVTTQSALASEEAMQHRAGALEIAGTSAAAGEDEPRVLHILPWQPPSVARRPRSEFNGKSPRLLAPIEPELFDRHRRLYQTLDPALDSRFYLY